MTILSRQSTMRAGPFVLLVTALVVYPCVSCAEHPAARAFALRNQNPFLQIFGQPAFQSAVLARPGEAEYPVSLDLANHADAGNTTLENFVIDGANWQATERFAVAMQIYAQGSYFDSELEELGGDTVQLAVGADYRTRDKGLLLALALVEDVSADATTNFALHFSIHSGGGR